MKFKLKPGMLVKSKHHESTCIVLSVVPQKLKGYKTQMYVLYSDLLIDKFQKTFWLNSLLADDKYEVLYEAPSW